MRAVWHWVRAWLTCSAGFSSDRVYQRIDATYQVKGDDQTIVVRVVCVFRFVEIDGQRKIAELGAFGDVPRVWARMAEVAAAREAADKD